MQLPQLARPSNAGMALAPCLSEVGGLLERLSLTSGLIWLTVLMADAPKQAQRSGRASSRTIFPSDKGWVASRIVRSPAEEVFDHLVTTLRAETASLGAGYADALSVDPQRRTLTITGHWWYQGTYMVEAQPGGSCVTYTVKNIARRARILAFLDKPAYARRMRRELDARLLVGEPARRGN
jgi:hypothetical protein